MGRPKQSEVKEVVPVRLDEARRAALQTEGELRELGLSQVIRLHLDRYPEIAWRDLPKLREAEWCATFEALGVPPVDVQAIEWVGATVARAVEAGDLARKWKIDAGELAAAARAWTFGQSCAVVDAAQRFRRELGGKVEPLDAARKATTRPPSLVLTAPAGARPRPSATRTKKR